MKNKHLNVFLLLCLISVANAEVPVVLNRFLNQDIMRGASFSLIVKEVKGGEVLYSYDANRQLSPASTMKLVTTAAALEILGTDYKYVTTIEYDGNIKDSTLNGNIYIKGSGDPTLGSSHFAYDRERYTPDQNTFIPQWLNAINSKGISSITGNIVADESIFDTEGISMKFVREDLGSDYGAACYGLSAFDNIYKLYINSGANGSKPEIVSCVPSIPSIRFHNYLTSVNAPADSSYIVGSPFSGECYLYGSVPANSKMFMMRGSIPDPPLFLANYLYGNLLSAGININGIPNCYRILSEEQKWNKVEKKKIVSTYSPPLIDIVRITNERSHNLYADALLRTLGLSYKVKSGEVISSAGRGVKTVREHWEKKGFDTSPLWMYDGCGVSIADKLSASFLCDLLVYMAVNSKQSEAFVSSLPQAGLEGTVRNFLKGSALQGKAFLKSGGMSRVRSYAGYVDYNNKRYAVVMISNNYNCNNQVMIQEMEKLMLGLFKF